MKKSSNEQNLSETPLKAGFAFSVRFCRGFLSRGFNSVFLVVLTLAFGKEWYVFEGGYASAVTAISTIVISPVVMCYVTWLMIVVRFFITMANSLGP